MLEKFDPTEFDCVWDGSHQGEDRDLLAGGVSRQRKRLAETPGHTERLTERVLATLRVQSMLTVTELVALVNHLPHHVTEVLDALRTEGRVEAVETETSAWGDPVNRYRLAR